MAEHSTAFAALPQGTFSSSFLPRAVSTLRIAKTPALTQISDRFHSPVGVDTTEQLRGELHVVEVVNDRLPVGLDLSLGDLELSSTGGRRSGRRLFRPEKN